MLTNWASTDYILVRLLKLVHEISNQKSELRGHAAETRSGRLLHNPCADQTLYRGRGGLWSFMCPSPTPTQMLRPSQHSNMLCNPGRMLRPPTFVPAMSRAVFVIMSNLQLCSCSAADHCQAWIQSFCSSRMPLLAFKQFRASPASRTAAVTGGFPCALAVQVCRCKDKACTDRCRRRCDARYKERRSVADCPGFQLIVYLCQSEGYSGPRCTHACMHLNAK